MKLVAQIIEPVEVLAMTLENSPPETDGAVSQRFREMLIRLQADPDRISGLNLVYQFVVLGEQEGDQTEWQLRLQDGSAEICPGMAPEADMGCTLTTEDFLALTSGQVSGRDLFFAGRMQVDGNALLGLVLNRIFN